MLNRLWNGYQETDLVPKIHWPLDGSPARCEPGGGPAAGVDPWFGLIQAKVT